MGHSLSNNGFRLWRKIGQIIDGIAEAPGCFLLAISGGRDSLALLKYFVEVGEKKNVSWQMAHVFHGESQTPEIQRYRYAAQARVQDWANQLGRRLYVAEDVLAGDVAGADSQAGTQGSTELKSEAELRDYRYFILKNLRNKLNAVRIVTAHHAEDLLETRMLNLIRGAGSHGLQSLNEDDGVLFRPFLDVWPRDLQIENFLKDFPEVLDPSNADTKFRRNWLRRWLREMSDEVPGSKVALARSLENIAQLMSDTDAQTIAGITDKVGTSPVDNSRLPLIPLSRETWIGLSLVQRRCVLAKALRENQIKNYTSRHIDEIIKRLDTPRKSLTFYVIGCEWQVVNGMINVSPSSR